MALTFANKVTIGRIFIVPFFVATVLYYSPQRDHLRFVALGIFLLAVTSDLIDGYIARAHKQKTKAGALLDPLADKFLLMSAFICLYKIGGQFLPFNFPLWLVVAVISRDVILLLGSMIIQLVNGQLVIAPTLWGKATTFFQVFCVIGLLMQIEVSSVLWSVTVILTIISAFGYIYDGIKTLNASSPKSNP